MTDSLKALADTLRHVSKSNAAYAPASSSIMAQVADAIDTHANELEVAQEARHVAESKVSQFNIALAESQAENLKLREALAKAKRLLVSKPFVGEGYSTQFINDELAALPSAEALREFGRKCADEMHGDADAAVDAVLAKETP